MVTTRELRGMKAACKLTNDAIAGEMGLGKNGSRYVSKVLNDKEYVSDKALQRIKRAILALDKSKTRGAA